MFPSPVVHRRLVFVCRSAAVVVWAPAAASLLVALPRHRQSLENRVYFFLFIYAGGAYAQREKPASERP